MTSRFYDRAQMNTATVGTNAVTLSTATTGCQTFALAGVPNAAALTLLIQDLYVAGVATAWEICTSVYTAVGTSCTRVLRSSSTGSLLVLSGSATVAVICAATELDAFALVSGTLGQFAATSSAQLAGVISDATGSGALVFAGTPTLVTPVLGVATATRATITPAANTEALTVSGGSVTGSGAASFASIAGTWNTSGAPTAFKINITNTASNGGSLLIDLQTSSSSQFSVRNDGLTTATSFATTGLGYRAPTGGYFFWSTRCTITSPADGVIKFTDTSEGSFGRLQLGGTTSSFPAIKRSSAALAFRLADDSADADISAAKVIASAPVRFPGYTVATLPASSVQGDNAFVTDALAPSFLASVVGGGTIVTPVFYNGSAWVGA